MAQRRRTSKHELFLDGMQTMESQLEPNFAAFTTLQALCVGQGIMPRPSGAVPAKDGDSVSASNSGMSVREFLEMIADQIHQEEVVYDKFTSVLSIALGQDSSPTVDVDVIREAPISQPISARSSSESSSSDTDLVDSNLSDVPDPPNEQGQFH